MSEIWHHICENENPNEIVPDSVENPVLIEGGHTAKVFVKVRYSTISEYFILFNDQMIIEIRQNTHQRPKIKRI